MVTLNWCYTSVTVSPLCCRFTLVHAGSSPFKICPMAGFAHSYEPARTLLDGGAPVNTLNSHFLNLRSEVQVLFGTHSRLPKRNALVVRRAWRCGRDPGFILKLHPIDVFRAHSDRVAELDVLLGSIAPRGPGKGLGRGIAGLRERDQTIRHLVGKLSVVGRPIARGPKKI